MAENDNSVRYMDIETKERIKELYLANVLTYVQIAQEVGGTKTCVDTFIRRCVKRGELPEVDRRKQRSQNAKNQTKKPAPKYKFYEPEGKTVNCTKAASKRCIYGAAISSHYCDFYLVTGMTRYNPEIVAKYGLTTCKNCNLFVSKKNKKKRKPRPFEMPN